MIPVYKPKIPKTMVFPLPPAGYPYTFGKITPVEDSGVVYISATSYSEGYVELVPADTLAILVGLETLIDYPTMKFPHQYNTWAIDVEDSMVVSSSHKGIGTVGINKSTGATIYEGANPIEGYSISLKYLPEVSQYCIGNNINTLAPTLLILDSTLTQVANIAAGVVPFYLTSLPATGRLWASYTNVNSSKQFNTTSYAVTATIPYCVLATDQTFLYGCFNETLPSITTDPITVGNVVKLDLTGALLITKTLGTFVRCIAEPYGSESFIAVVYLTSSNFSPANFSVAFLAKDTLNTLATYVIGTGVDILKACIDSRGYVFMPSLDGSVFRAGIEVTTIPPSTTSILSPLLSTTSPTHAYIPNYLNASPNYITKLDLLTQITTQLPLPSAFAPSKTHFDGTNVWIACYGLSGTGNNLVCLSQSGTVLANLTLYSGITCITQFNSYLYVSCYDYASGLVYKLDLSGNIISTANSATISGNYVFLNSLTTDGTYIYSHVGASGFSSNIVRWDMDLANQTILTVGATLPQNVYIQAIGNFLFSYNSTSVFKFDSSGALVATFTVPTAIGYLVSDGTSLFACASGYTYKLNTTTGAIITTYTHVNAGTLTTAVGSNFLVATDYSNSKVEILTL
jgi:hypothetical protein